MRLQDYVAGNTAPPAIDEVVSRIQDISTLPNVAMKAMEIANDPDSSAIDLVRVVETEPSLSARILRCVNSSAYALRERITNLQRAISFLGMREIRRLAVTASVSELFRRDEVIGTYQRRGLWKHLVAVALCSRLIAMRQQMEGFEDAFLAGLLHDIGIVFEDQYVHDRFRVMVESLDNNKTLSEAERKLLGFDHAKLGAQVAEAWRFPENVKAAISHHHMSVNYRGEAIMIVRCVEVANLICTVKGYPSVGRKLVQVSQPALNALSLTREHLAVLAHDLEEELAKNASLIDL